MSEFTGFSEAAKLYADKLAIVTAMKELFEREITEYLDALADAVRDQLETSDFRDESKPSYRYWWIGKDMTSPRKYSAICFRKLTPSILTDKLLHLQVEAPAQPAERVAQLKQLASHPNLPFLQPSKNGWSSVDAIIKCDDADLIESPARDIAAFLKELSRIDAVYS